jgi:hypothetical protein
MVGVLTLVFHVLPNLHPLQGLAYMTALSLLPSLVALVTTVRGARALASFKSLIVLLLQGKAFRPIPN